MTLRTTAAVLAALTIGGSSLVLAAGDDHDHGHDAWRQRHREVAREARNLVRETGHDAVREVRAAMAWVWTGGWQDDRAERNRARAERRREAAERRRAARDARRDEATRQRDERAFRTVSPTDDPCAESWSSRRGHACEVRDSRLPAPVGPLTVDAAPNGGIRVEAWDQADVLVRAVVHAYGDNDADAKELLGQVGVNAAGAQVSAEGPERTGRNRGWSVSYRVWAPPRTALSLTSRNGGVALHGMRGESRFSTTNGGVTLDEIGGRVAGSTRNGGVRVRLGGVRWEGEGLDVTTTNGGVTLLLPPGYSAELEASTVNGGVRTTYPLAVQDRLGRQVRATLGSGGAPLKVATTNGGVRITER